MITANCVKERVKPEILEKDLINLVHQPLPGQKLFHFQDWYRFVTACNPREWKLHILANRTYRLSPEMSVRAALNLKDSWMRINGEDQRLPHATWADLKNICSPPPKCSQKKDPPVKRTFGYRDEGSRPDYSAFISYSTEDFLPV